MNKMEEKEKASWSKLLAVDSSALSTANPNDAGVKKLQIIGAGLPRTGTTSLKEALDILGFGPVLHDHGGQVKEFIRLIEAKTDQLKSQEYERIRLIASTAPPKSNQEKVAEADKNLQLIEAKSGVSLSEITDGYKSILDSPIMDFYSELLHLHPNALVIIGVRDSDSSWWKSYLETIGRVVDPSWKGLLLRLFIWPVREETHVLGEKVTELWKVRYGGWGQDIHSKHLEMVRKEVQEKIGEDRLLVWNVKDGWKPLCKLLGVDVPDMEFPKLNDTKEMKAFVGKKYPKAVVFWVGVWLAMVWVCFLIGMSYDWSGCAKVLLSCRYWLEDVWDTTWEVIETYPFTSGNHSYSFN